MEKIVKRLSQEEFLETFKNVPRVAVNLIITDVNNKVLLTRRNIPPCFGEWHFPGSFLLKNETIDESKKRIAKDEFNLDLGNKELSLLGVFEDLEGDPRGHVIDVAYGMKIDNVSQIGITKETMEVKFFEKLPNEIGFNHRDTLHKLGYKDEE